jgi:vacuolar-type H+-ATPase subunit I/STV1
MKPSSRKKSKATMTKMQTVLTSDDFDFIIATLNDASLEIVEKQETKQEEMYDRSESKLRGVQQALQSSLRSLHCASAIRRTRVGR